MIIADEPIAFKIIKYICFALLVAASAVTKFHIGPDFLGGTLAIAGTSGYSVASFAFKEANLLINGGINAGSVSQVITDTSAEISTLKTEIKAPAPVPDLEGAVSKAYQSFEIPSKEPAPAQAEGKTPIEIKI